MSAPATTVAPNRVVQQQASAWELAQAIQNGQTTSLELVEDAYERIATMDGTIGAFLSLTKEKAIETASQVDADAKAGKPLKLLAGVPIALKDNMNMTGTKTTCASKILKGYVSPYNATVVEKLVANGLPVVGKTNLDEFAMGSSNENSAYGLVKNPVDIERVPGGSSGGSAAAVAAGMVSLSLGSDTGGSIRQPASLCGLVGVKPTYGSVSRFGLVAFASSLDQIGPFARTVTDAAALYQVIAGHDERDATSRADATPTLDIAALAAGGEDLKGLRVGVLQELDGISGDSKKALQPETIEAFHKGLDTLKALGATLTTVSLPSTQYSVPIYYILATAEASSNLGRYDGVRYGHRADAANLHPMYRATRAEGFGPEVKRRILLGTFCLSAGYYDAFYGKAQQARRLMTREFAETFAKVDVLVCPTSPCTAFKFGEKSSDPLAMYLSDIATIPANIAGVPAISVPCGVDALGLPIGLQITGPHLSEAQLFHVARAFEAATASRA
ncbi:MAG: Asp-tRNA(Asn)/Glu-tRNA(Gln) amidotransferase subunit GatA [Vampirovibrionales bacterium]|nr:Asp-tRNA(Asn)/Glu-tRNA(Gln) amidotransferase subunit GatA [Vampirovibrionales bacterium]